MYKLSSHFVTVLKPFFPFKRHGLAPFTSRETVGESPLANKTGYLVSSTALRSKPHIYDMLQQVNVQGPSPRLSVTSLYFRVR